MPYREAERPVLPDVDPNNERERLEGELAVLQIRRDKWDSFYQHALDVLVLHQTEAVAAKRARELADRAYELWLPRDIARRETGTKICSELIALGRR